MAHALFAPSSAKRLISCPASLALHTDTGAGEHAALGTVAHFVHERVLKGVLRDSYEAVGEVHTLIERDKVFTFTIDVPMADAVQESIELIYDRLAEMRRMENDEPVLHVEIRANISRWTPIEDQFGTSDVVMLAGTNLCISDYKHGSGVLVKAQGNPQLALYALGVLDEYDGFYDIETVTMQVNQPRMNNFDTWTVSKAELLAFGDYIAERFALAIEHDAPFGPSEDACKFCGAKARCPALAALADKVVAAAFDDLESDDVTDPKTLPAFDKIADAKLLKPAELSFIWQKAKLIEGYLEAVRTACEHLLLHGEVVPDLKLVEGRGSRKWTDETQARQTLEALGVKKGDYLKVTLISPAQAEDFVPKRQREPLIPLIEKLPGKPTVAHASDKREAITPAVNAFDDLDDDDCGL